MKDFVPMRGEYEGKGWNPQIRDSILAQFIRVIRGADLVGFGIGLDADA